MRLHFAVALVISAALIILTYMDVFTAPFIFDDGLYIINNPRITDLHNFWPPGGARYLTYLSIAFNYKFGGLSTSGYHTLNIAIHLTNALLLYWLVNITFRTPLFGSMEKNERSMMAFYTAIISMAVFASHPVQTQAVSYVTQRFASLATMFYLLSVALYVKWRLGESGRFCSPSLYIGSLAAAVAAQYAKEISFTLPVIIALYELSFFRGFSSPVRRLKHLIPFMAVLAILPLTFLAPGSGAGDVGASIEQMQLDELSRLSRYTYLVTQFRVVATYLRLMVFPAWQNLDYDYPVYNSFLAPEVVASVILEAALFSGACYLFIRSYKARSGLPALAAAGVAWFFITLSIESSLIPIQDVIFEHRLYLPATGLAVTFASGAVYVITRLRQRFGLKITVSAALLMFVTLIPLARAAHVRNHVWTDELVFWKDVTAKSPGKWRPHNNLGTVYYKMGDYARAAESFRESIRIKQNFADSHYNLSNAYRNLGRLDDAIAECELALSYNPRKMNARNNLGLMYYEKGRTEEAIEMFKSVLEVEPDNYMTRNNLGLALAYAGHMDTAIAEFERALEIKPGFTDARYNLKAMLSRRTR